MQKISELLSQFRGAKAIVFMGSVDAAIAISTELLIPIIISEIPKNERELPQKSLNWLFGVLI